MIAVNIPKSKASKSRNMRNTVVAAGENAVHSEKKKKTIHDYSKNRQLWDENTT